MIIFHRRGEILQGIQRGSFEFSPGRLSASITVSEGEKVHGFCINNQEAAELGRRLIAWSNRPAQVRLVA